MIYSKTSGYGLRALSYLAAKPRKALTTVKEVRQKLRIPQAYVAKIFQCLARKKILTSCRGPSGGYGLRMNPSGLTVMEVIEVLEDFSKSPLANCVMGLERCGDKNPCPLHPIWARAKEKIVNKLGKITVRDMAKLAHRGKWSRGIHPTLSKEMKKVFGQNAL